MIILFFYIHKFTLWQFLKRSLKISKVYESLLSSRSFQFVYEHVYNEYKCLANVLFIWIPDSILPYTFLPMYFNCIVLCFYLVSFFFAKTSRANVFTSMQQYHLKIITTIDKFLVSLKRHSNNLLPDKIW